MYIINGNVMSYINPTTKYQGSKRREAVKRAWQFIYTCVYKNVVQKQIKLKLFNETVFGTIEDMAKVER